MTNNIDQKIDEATLRDMEMFYEQRLYYDKGRVNASNILDRYLLTISTGSLYLTFLITSQLGIPNGSERFVWVASGLFILAMLAVLISIMFSINSHQIQINTVDKMIIALRDQTPIPKQVNKWNKRIKYMRSVAIVAIIEGTFLLAIFYFLIIQNGQ